MRILKHHADKQNYQAVGFLSLPSWSKRFCAWNRVKSISKRRYEVWRMKTGDFASSETGKYTGLEIASENYAGLLLHGWVSKIEMKHHRSLHKPLLHSSVSSYTHPEPKWKNLPALKPQKHYWPSLPIPFERVCHSFFFWFMDWNVIVYSTVSGFCWPTICKINPSLYKQLQTVHSYHCIL